VYSNQPLEQLIVSNIKQITLNKTLQTLKALGAEYIIKDSEGNTHTHGTLALAEPAPEKKRLPRSGVPHGALSGHIRNHVDSMQVGDVVCVPMYLGGNMKSLHSTVSSYTLKMWGVGNSTTHKDPANNCIEVMRLG
jgi:hypothetical protein